MPITKSAEKELRKNKNLHARNLAIKSPLKEKIKTLRKIIAAKKTEEAKKLLSETIKALDKAAQKKVIKKNTANRHKSRLTRQVNQLVKTAT